MLGRYRAKISGVIGKFAHELMKCLLIVCQSYTLLTGILYSFDIELRDSSLLVHACIGQVHQLSISSIIGTTYWSTSTFEATNTLMIHLCVVLLSDLPVFADIHNLSN